jgi:predicted RNase H-related nuclease YkuK (DUF458 family)
MEALKFKKVDGTTIENVEQYVKNWVKKNPYGKIIIGCDSQPHGRRIKFSCVVILHYKDECGQGKGAHVIIADVWEKRLNKTQVEELPNKLWREAEYALQAAQMINGTDELFRTKIEVHLDLNSIATSNSHENLSNIMYGAGLGLLSGYGYKVFGKPDSVIASNCADHFCR